MNTFTIPTSMIPHVEAKLVKANRRAAKLGMASISIETSDPIFQTVQEESPYTFLDRDGKLKIALVEIAVHGEAPVIEGYRFVALVDCRGENPVVKTIPGSDDVDLHNWQNEVDPGRCDHCHTNRRRHDVLILQETDTGKLIQIGRACGADFFRSKNAAAMIRVLDTLQNLGEFDEDDFASAPRAENYVPLLDVLEITSAVVRKEGYRGSDDEMPTKYVVEVDLFRREFEVEEVDKKTAIEVRDWLVSEFKNKPVEDRTNFESNVAAVIEGDYIRTRNIGFVVWSVSGYARKKAQEAAKEASDYVGTVGKRETFTATFVSARHFDSSYGVKTLVTFKTPEDNIIIWWATNDPQFDEGTEYTFDATVKAHNEYNSVAQTVVNRLKVK